MSSGVTKKPAIPHTSSKGIQPELWNFLVAIREILENYEGVSGKDDDKIITRKDLRRLGLNPVALNTNNPTYNFQANSAKTTAPKTVSSDYTLQIDDHVILVDASGGDVIITLLNAEKAPNNSKYFVKKTDSSANLVTLTTVSSQTIDGAATKVLSAENDVSGFISDNNNWYIL